MRRTRKRGGKSDPILEKNELARLAREAEPLTGTAKTDKYKELFRLVLTSTHLVRVRYVRRLINIIIDKTKVSDYTDEELNALMNDVRRRMLAIPDGELTGGGRGGASDIELESQQIDRLIREANRVSSDDKLLLQKLKEFFNFALTTTYIIKSKTVRNMLDDKMEQISTSDIMDDELKNIILALQDRMDSVPENELIGGKRTKRKTRKARKTRKSRKNYRK